MFGDLLEWFQATHAAKTNTGISRIEKEDAKGFTGWLRFLDDLEDSINAEGRYYVNFRRHGTFEYFIKSSILLELTDENGVEYTCPRNVRFTKGFKKTLKDKWNEMGVCNLKQVLMSSTAKILIQVPENLQWELNGMLDDEEMGWETPSGSDERLIEILGTWLISHDKVPAGVKWEDLWNSLLGLEMHEG